MTQQYSDFIKSVGIRDISLKSLSCEKLSNAKKKIIDPNPPQDEFYFDASVSFDFSLSEQKHDLFVALAKFKIFVTHKNNEKDDEEIEERGEFLIQFEYELLYNYDFEKANDEIFEVFINKNVPINIWPYARELISSLTSRMGYAPLILGSFKSI